MDPDKRIKRDFVVSCLGIIKNVFEEESNLGIDASKELIFATFAEIIQAHAEYSNDPDFICVVIVDYFLCPLKKIIPESVKLAPMFTVYINESKRLIFELKMLDSYLVEELISGGKFYKDPRVTIFDNWGLLIRMDKVAGLLSGPQS